MANARIAAEDLEPGDSIMGQRVELVSRGTGIVIVHTADGARREFPTGHKVVVA